ncbi:hypothetical protein PHYBOEH_010870 [Phytophthora boehmeriae]|uniref:Isochorismatase-like domain-containing protein n=1 Tax=Phytophthora boehmeriae TaxID=109152 RepID=A0A8T1VQ83_9STRA|nr:hypothetical protein PHYBOEH_010870 [Phytophthora boehmeriae]
MFWPFLELQDQLVYCPLADFGACGARAGQDLYAQAVVAQPVTAHLPLKNALEIQGKIAVLQRGICDFVTKVLHAQRAGAIAVIVANNSGDDSGDAFVMDAGQRQDQLEETVDIPAMMVSRSHSTEIFQQIREAFLDRRELTFTIRFLGTDTASRVLAQQESLALQQRNAMRCVEIKEQREQQQQEAATLLRNRLGKVDEGIKPPAVRATRSAIATPSTSASEVVGWSPLSSCESSSACSTHRTISGNRIDDASPSNNQEEDQLQSMQGAAALAMQHWCPMTTALVILDVQNYFVLRHGYGEKHVAKDHEVRPTDPTQPERHSNTVDLGFYDRVDNVLIPTIQDVLLASRATEGMEIVYSVVESATRDGRERSRAHKHAGIHVPRHGFGAQVPKRVAPDDGCDIVLPRTGVDAFAATNLDYILRNLMVSHIVVMGISVLGSVEACVQTALDRGYQVTVVKEALLPLAGVSGCKMVSTLDGFAKRGVQVLTAADFVDKLQSFA